MKLTFLGAAQVVTGSAFLIETDENKILVDCGMFQGGKTLSELNYRDFSFSPGDLDGVILTHAHIDHSGLLPKLCKEGFSGRIYATKVTTELCGIMLPDSAHIQEFEAEIINRKGRRAGKKMIEPLYVVADAYACLNHFVPIPYDKTIEIVPGIKIRFRDAGHILGSAMVEVWVKDATSSQKLVFSGDIGQPGQPIIKEPSFIDEADYVIMESTYGNRVHEQIDKKEILAEIVNDTVRRGGNVVIPAFAVGRTQTLLYYFLELFQEGRLPDIPIIIDSPLAISATDVFMRNVQDYDTDALEMVEAFKKKTAVAHMPQLKFTRSAEESKAINTIKKSAIIISASGMADAGRILHHLKHNLWRPQSSVLLVGYQAEGSLGRRLQEGVRRVKIMGEEVGVAAKIYSFDGFSAHGDKNFLREWLEHFTVKPANVFVMHGEPEMAEPFADVVKNELGLSAYVPLIGDSAIINGRQWRIEESQEPRVVVEDPELQQIKDNLAQLEAQYVAYRQNLDKMATAKNPKAIEALKQLEVAAEGFKKFLTIFLKNT